MPVPRGLRATLEVVPKLGVKAGFPALRIGAVAKYDRPLEHLCGDLDVAQLKLQRVILTTPWVDNKVPSLGEQVYATRYVRRRRPAKV